MPSAPHLSALFQSRRNPAARVGAERVALLREIGRLGSISAAAKATGFSYKGAWDAVQALNNLFEQPLVVSRAGGAHGGTAVVTPAGEALLSAFSRIETALSQVSDQLAAAISAGDAASAGRFAHNLKGSSAGMGGETLSQIAAQMQEAGKEGNLAGLVELLPAARAAMEKLSSLLEQECF